NRDIVDPVPAYREIMFFSQTVHVNAECEIFRRRVFIELALEQNRIGAEIDVLFSGDQTADDFGHFRVDERLPARDADHRGAAFVRRRPALLRRQPLIEHVIRILDFSASCAREVAAEKRLQHENQRIALGATETLAEHIRRDRIHLGYRNRHRASYLKWMSSYDTTKRLIFQGFLVMGGVLMKRKVEYIFAGNNGKPVYVQGYLTDESGSVKLQVVSTNPEPRPAPGLYEAGNLPGG